MTRTTPCGVVVADVHYSEHEHRCAGCLRIERDEKTRLLDSALAENKTVALAAQRLAEGLQVEKAEVERLKKDIGFIDRARQDVILQNAEMLSAFEYIKGRLTLGGAQEKACEMLRKYAVNRVGTSPTERPCCVEAYARGYNLGHNHGKNGSPPNESLKRVEDQPKDNPWTPNKTL